MKDGGWQSRLTLNQFLPEGLNLRLVLLISRHELVLGIAKQDLELLNPFIPSQQLSFRNCSFLFERTVLLHKLQFQISLPATTQPSVPADLLLHVIECVQVVFQEFQFPLLRSRIRGACDDFVLLPDVVQLHLELDDLVPPSNRVLDNSGVLLLTHLLTAVLKIFHQAFLDNVEFAKLKFVALAYPLELSCRADE